MAFFCFGLVLFGVCGGSFGFVFGVFCLLGFWGFFGWVGLVWFGLFLGGMCFVCSVAHRNSGTATLEKPQGLSYSSYYFDRLLIPNI